jgi:hypothetical protein
MKIDTVIRTYKVIKATADLAWHMGFLAGKTTQKFRKPAKKR